MHRTMKGLPPMSYSDFTLKEVTRRFGLAIAETQGMFAAAPEVEPSPLLRELLQEYLPLARAINTEKARSELHRPLAALAEKKGGGAEAPAPEAEAAAAA